MNFELNYESSTKGKSDPKNYPIQLKNADCCKITYCPVNLKMMKKMLNIPTRVLTRTDKETGAGYDVSIDEQIEEKKARTQLAKYMWQLKEQGLAPGIRWFIERRAFEDKIGHRYCDLNVSI